MTVALGFSPMKRPHVAPFLASTGGHTRFIDDPAFPDGIASLDDTDLETRAHAIGLSAMTFHFLIVSKDTEMLFDPGKSTPMATKHARP